jgi:hypothetical protein
MLVFVTLLLCSAGIVSYRTAVRLAENKHYKISDGSLHTYFICISKETGSVL